MALNDAGLEAAAQLVDPSSAFGMSWRDCKDRAKAVVEAYLASLPAPQGPVAIKARALNVTHETIEELRSKWIANPAMPPYQRIALANICEIANAALEEMTEPKAGFMLVPAKPTIAMRDAAMKAWTGNVYATDEGPGPMLYAAMIAAAPQPPSPDTGTQHPDDEAVDRFAEAMKAKLAKKRGEGRGGWENKDECSAEFLSELLRGHVAKGDPVDVANLAMMLNQRGETIAPPDTGAQGAEPVQPVAAALARQVQTDLASAHEEICRLQGIDPATHSWPAWSPQRHTLDWCAKIIAEAALAQPQASREARK